VVIAEGTETIKPAREAAAAGATIGQGCCSATRRRCPPRCRRPGGHPLQAPADAAVETPWEVVAAAASGPWS
jgi:hypothetical protein